MAHFDRTTSCIYSLKKQARCLAPQMSSSDNSRFFIGTLGLKQENELHLLDFDEDVFEITSHIWQHTGEVWNVSPSPTIEALVFTTSRQIDLDILKHSAILWKLPKFSVGGNSKLLNHSGKMQEILSIPSKSQDLIEKVIWDIHHENRIAAIFNHSIDLKVLNSDYKITESNCIFSSEKIINAAKWSPHGDEIAVGHGTNIIGLDTRAPFSHSFSIKDAHSIAIHDIDYNCNKPFILASAGKDCTVKIWDTRNTNNCVKMIEDHSHWIWSLGFNRFHDQLFISGSSDCSVNLSSVFTISSSKMEIPKSEDDDAIAATSQDEIMEIEDGLILSYEQHEESVYSTAWSMADPWIFASLSFDGICSINFVPEDHKYKIMGV